ATFILNLGNTTQSDEAREYHLRVIQGTNPDGAVIKVAGVPMGGALSYFIPPGEQFTAALTVERGPLAYDYENLQIMFYPPCQYELWQNNLPIMIADTVMFSVHFQSPCSEVNLLLPENNWVVNLSNNDTLQVIINDYDIDNPYLESLKFQYRRMGENWETAFFYLRNSIPQDYILEYWDVSNLLDGTYELRVVTDCDAMGLNYSAISTGIIDRNALMVLGNPEPSDGILNLGEDISISFTDEIDQEYIDVNENISLISEDLTAINVSFAAYENTLFINTIEDISTYENQTLTATVSGIKDIHGNQLRSPAVWSFRVSQNPVYWTVSNVNLTIYQGSQENIIRTLKNAGGEDESFTITRYPAWLSPSPVNGNIPAEGEQQITLSIDSQLNPGSYHDTVFVATT
ncbi:MAG: hypothetical protein KAR38_07935, partial [Calditrichia bacterium]|nr:hypothetical protein [Calditrichia bacterium]